MTKLFDYLLQLVKGRWTGKVSLYFHEGGLTKIEETRKKNGIL